MALSMIPLSLVPAAFVWQWPNLEQLAWLVLIGLLGGSGQYCVAEALRRSDAALVMPVDFCKLLWVSVIAWVAFGEVADRYTWLGGAVIFASTVYIAYRERARASDSVTAPTSRTPLEPGPTSAP
jgi:drug/metabolite transporter (DMT)-like permease